MNRREFLNQLSTAAAAGCALGYTQHATAQDVRPVFEPPRLTVERGAETPVQLQSVRIVAEVSGSRALTTVEMVFFNPNQRVLEGELQFPLLDGQHVAGFALDIDGVLREAVPVEKAKGQQVFEDVIRTRIDPALLQTTLGNNYKLRVYPLPARGTRRVSIRYAETLAAMAVTNGTAEGLRRYRVPLDYARQLSSFDLRVTVRAPQTAPLLKAHPDGLTFRTRGTDYEAEISHKDYHASGLLEVHLPASTRPEVHTQTVDGKTYFLAEVPARKTITAPRHVPSIVGIVWDASGSGATRDRTREFALLDTYCKRIGNNGNGEVRLTRLRDTAEAVERFRIVNGDWRALKRALEATPYDGATHLGAFQAERDVQEYLLFSDGLDNFGGKPFAHLTVPLYAISTTVSADPARLRRIADASGGKFLNVHAQGAADAARGLLYNEPRIVGLHGDGVTLLTAASRMPDNRRWLVAGQLTGERGLLRVTVSRGGPASANETLSVPLQANHGTDHLTAAAWAHQRLAELDGEYRLNRAEIRRLGMAFNLTSRETSLIVLDRIEDYVRHEIVPPPELRAEYERQRRTLHARADDERARQLERVLRLFREKTTWWEKDFPKNARPQPDARKPKEAERRQEADDGALRDERCESNRPRLAEQPPVAAPAASPARPAPAAARALALDGAVAGRLAKSGDGIAGGTAANVSAPAPASVAIQLKRATPDAPYFARFRDAANTDLYRVYLDERAGYLNSTAFFLDAADAFFDKGLTVLGVRVLSNLAEMELENRHILRILGYRLMQAGHARLAIPILARVLELAPNEPQSYRDLGLAYAADKQWQQAVDHLQDVVIRPWHGRFPEIELTALDELNAIVATAGTPVDVSGIDRRLLRNLPVDLRVALSWDSDNTDIDLWVTDPNGEKAYYGNRFTYQGGRVSMDYTGGYGPETFSLKHAKPGKYKVEANFYGHNQQIVAGATTLQLKLVTRFGTSERQEQTVTLRLKGRSEVVQVGEFEVKS